MDIKELFHKKLKEKLSHINDLVQVQYAISLADEALSELINEQPALVKFKERRNHKWIPIDLSIHDEHQCKNCNTIRRTKLIYAFGGRSFTYKVNGKWTDEKPECKI